MTPTQNLNRRIASYGNAEAQALIHFLIKEEVWSVANRLSVPDEIARDNISTRALDFLGELQKNREGL